MTENVFYPVFVCFCLVLVRTLEQPTARRQIAVARALRPRLRDTGAGGCAAAGHRRRARCCSGVIERNVRGVARSFVLTYAHPHRRRGARRSRRTVLRGRSPLSLLGAYRAATTSSYSAREIAKFLLWHVAELDLYLGVIPFAALLALWLSARSLSPAGRAFAAASLPVCVFLIAEVAAFATQPSVQRIEERNMFYVAPLALIALFAVGARLVPVSPRRRRGGLRRRGRPAAHVPVRPRSSARAPRPTRSACCRGGGCIDHGLPPHDVRLAAFAAARPRGRAVRRAAERAVRRAAAARRCGVRPDQRERRQRPAGDPRQLGRLALGRHQGRPPELDRPGRRARRRRLRPLARARRRAHRLGERVLQPQRAHDLRPERRRRPATCRRRRCTRCAAGRLADASGRVVRAQYALADEAADVEGKVVASDPQQGLSLVRVDGPLVLQTHVSGRLRRLVVGAPGGLHALRLHRRQALGRPAERPASVLERPGRHRDDRPGRCSAFAACPADRRTAPDRAAAPECRRRLPGRLHDGARFARRPTSWPGAPTPASSACASCTSTSAHEDRLRREPALARADGREQLHPGHAGRPRRGRLRARPPDRRLRADVARGQARHPRGPRAASTSSCVSSRFPARTSGAARGRSPATRSPSGGSAGSTRSTSPTGCTRRSGQACARRRSTTSCRCTTPSGRPGARARCTAASTGTPRGPAT